MINISAIIITNNSSDIIERTVKAVKWCDEIIVVDSGSIDNTVSICNELGCKTFRREFTGYGDQKNYAAGLAKNDWVLSVDADEVISDELRNEIIQIFNSEKIEYSGFFLPVTLFFCGRKFKHCENSKPHLRLFNKRLAQFNLSKVHEKVETKGTTKILKNELLHYSFRNISHYIQKMNIYTSRGAEEMFEKGKTVNGLVIFLRFPFDFIKFYLIRGCFLEGFPGFIWSMLSSFYPVIKYFKLYEIKKSIKK
jgi:glycosyltransferase involved in cell wall biosynthesis